MRKGENFIQKMMHMTLRISMRIIIIAKFCSTSAAYLIKKTMNVALHTNELLFALFYQMIKLSFNINYVASLYII